jgi:hypothetical protein
MIFALMKRRDKMTIPREGKVEPAMNKRAVIYMFHGLLAINLLSSVFL